MGTDYNYELRRSPDRDRRELHARAVDAARFRAAVSHATPVYRRQGRRRAASKTWTATASSISPAASAASMSDIAHPSVVAAIREQLDRFLHTCVQVTPYENYVAPRRAPERAHARQFRQEDVLRQYRRRSRRKRGQDRARLHQAPGHHLLRRRLPRPHLC